MKVATDCVGTALIAFAWCLFFVGVGAFCWMWGLALIFRPGRPIQLDPFGVAFCASACVCFGAAAWFLWTSLNTLLP